MAGTGTLLAKLETEFLPHDIDETGAPTASYYGFLNRSGAWYIIRITNSEQTIRYATQANEDGADYVTAWTNRASLTYTYLSSLNI